MKEENEMQIKISYNKLDNTLNIDIIKNNSIFRSFNLNKDDVFKIFYNTARENNAERLDFDNTTKLIKNNFEVLIFNENNMNFINDKNIIDKIIKAILEYLTSFVEIKSEYKEEELLNVEKYADNNKVIYFVNTRNTYLSSSDDYLNCKTYIIEFNPNMHITIYGNNDLFINDIIVYNDDITIYNLLHTVITENGKLLINNLATKIADSKYDEKTLYDIYFEILNKFHNNNLFDSSNEIIDNNITIL